MTAALTTPSYSQGCARCRADSARPRLWNRLLGLWAPFLGPTGLSLRDWSGFGNHGTLTNMGPGSGWVPTEMGYALDLDGSDDYIDCPGVGLNPSVLSVAAWICPDKTNNQVIVDKPFTSHVNPYYQYHFRVTTTSRLWIELAINGNRNAWKTDNNAVTQFAWNHVAVTYDGQQSPVVYVNGISVAIARQTGSDSSGPLAGYDTGLRIGRFTNVVSSPFDGRIGQISVHDRALIPDEIQQLHADTGAWFQPPRRITCRISAAPHRLAVGQVFHTGTMAGQTFNTGQSIGQVHG